ncbi:MAG: hypothetical protein RBT70_00125 [Alphaproteobacteria bacterium]|nr:hypothetical protein [Alphaproteobacteria bacterium]
MTEQNDKTPPRQDWNLLAKEAMDLWQNHLASLASDPKAKEEMIKFVTPMTQMYTQWASLMQSTFSGMMNPSESPVSPEQEAESRVWSSEPVVPEASSTASSPIDSPSDVSESAPAASSSIDSPSDVSESAPAASAAPVVTQAAAETISMPAVQPDVIQDKVVVSHESQPVVAPAPAAQPVASQPVPEPVAVSPEPKPVAASRPSGNAAPADGSRDLSELASRLAQLERELEAMRPRTKRSGSDSGSDSGSASAAS